VAIVAGLTALACGGAEPREAVEPPTTVARPPAPASSSTTATSSAPTTSTTTTPEAPAPVRPPAPATDPAGLAAQIEEAEIVLRDPDASPSATETAALAHQVAYRQLGVHPAWDAEVLASLPEPLRRPAELNAAARREFVGMHRTLSSTLPAWRIVDPDPPEDLLAIYRDAEATFGIPWNVLAAVHLVETGMGRIRGASVAGAQGPMQFLPATWEAYGAGGDINDTGDAVSGAARYLAANGGATDIGPALYRYNHSNRYVRGVRFYADLIAEHPRAFLAYYHWGIWYVTDQGDVHLPVGYDEPAPVPVADHAEG
jgi:membrane-bound lytic murein transglycosylase B